MALDGVPWFIGGPDAEHGPDVARQLAYLATGGKEGVGSPGDLKVSPLAVPGAGVRVAAGGASILNRVASQQAYTVRNPTTDTDSVKIAATGSGATRADLVICRVDNPYVDGNAQTPVDTVHGPYDKFDVIPGVPAGTTRVQDIPEYAGLSAITLARIDLPKSTGTVTSSMITDLRSLANPRTERILVKGVTSDAIVTMDEQVWKAFPPGKITGVQVPSWATHAAIRVETTMRYVDGNAYANFQSFIGLPGVQDSTTLFADALLDATTGGGSYRQPLLIPSDGLYPIPSGIRGRTVEISSRVRQKDVSGAAGRLASPASDYYFADITFTERIS